MAMSTVTAALLLALLPVTALGQIDQCTIHGEFHPQDGDYKVYAKVACEETGLRIQLVHTYTGTGSLGVLSGSRIQLFYECKDTLDNVTAGNVPDSYNYELDTYVYSVPLNSLLTESGASCRVFGCYEDNIHDISYFYYPILNGTCSYGLNISITPTVLIPTSTPVPITPAPPVVLQPPPQCTIGDDGREFRPQDDIYTVYAKVACEQTGLRIQLVHTYTGIGPLGTLPGSLIQLFYECKDTLDNVTAGKVSGAYNFELDTFVHNVPLNSLFTESGGASCRVFGCYDDNIGDNSYYYYPILNGTCSYGINISATPTVLIPMSTPSTPTPTATPQPPSQCAFGDGHEFQPQDGDHTVRPNLTCTDTGLKVQLVHTYPADYQLSRIMLSYECTDVYGNVAAGQVSHSGNSSLNEHNYSMQLTSSFTKPGTACRIFGCYEAAKSIYFIQISTCSYVTTIHTMLNTTIPSPDADILGVTVGVTVSVGVFLITIVIAASITVCIARKKCADYELPSYRKSIG